MIKDLPEDIAVKVKLSRIPEETYDKLDFAHFEANSGNEEALDALRDLLHSQIEYPIILLVGEPGLGKTHLAIALGWMRLMNKKSTCYYQVSELLDELRAGYKKEELSARSGEYNPDAYTSIMNYAKMCHTLILDDMGTQKDTDWAIEHLDNIVDFRYIHRKETLITSNTTSIPPRIGDRCKDGRIVLLKGESYRGKHGQLSS